MSSIYRFSIYLFLWLLLAMLAGCAPSASPVVWRDPAVDWVFPEPPQKARIRYLRSISQLSDIRGQSESRQKLIKWLGAEEVAEQPMISPYAVTANGEGRIWVTDPGVGLLYHIDLPYRKIDHFSIVSGRRLANPTGVVFDHTQKRLYLADAGISEILVFDAEHNYLLSLVPPDGFGRPGGLAVGPDGSLYVADVLKGTVEVFSSGGRWLKAMGSSVNADGKFNHPSNLAVDGEGRVYVVDSFNFRVEVVGLPGESAQIIGGLGDSPGRFARPRGIAVDSLGHVYVSDAAFDNVQIFNRSGELLLVLGRAGKGPDGFCMPAGLAFDPANRLYAVDNCAQQVKIFQFLGE